MANYQADLPANRGKKVGEEGKTPAMAIAALAAGENDTTENRSSERLAGRQKERGKGVRGR